MGKSKTNSKSRSISKWKIFSPFKSSTSPSAERASDARAEEVTAVSGSRHLSAESRSRSYTKHKKRDPVVETKPLDQENHAPPISPNPPTKEEKKEEKKEKKEEKKDDKEEKKSDKKEVGSKSEELKSPGGKKKEEKEEASVFEEVAGPAAPAQSGTHGIKNKLRWKIDVDPVDVNGDQKMAEVLEKFGKLKKKYKNKKCKVLKANEKTEEEEEPQEDAIISSARVLQLIKMESLISKELNEAEQETLKGFCRSGDHEEKAEALVEKIAIAALNAVVAKNEFIRQVSVPGQLRMFAVDEKKSKVPMMALMMARKDLLYVSWSKPNRDVEKEFDATWTNMTMKKVPQAAIQSTHL